MANETYTLIQKTTLNAAALTIEFSNIPQTFTDLVIKVSAKANGTGSSALAIQFNSTTSTYTTKRLYGDGSGAYSDSSATTNYLKVGFVSQSTLTNNFGSTEIYIPNYTSANQKSVSTDSVAEGNATTQYMSLMAGLWNGTSAITNIKLNIDNSLENFAPYSSFALYGVAKEGVNPVAGPKASGGDIITNDGTYWIHQFLNSGTFTPSRTLSTEYLVIAGGGGGGVAAAGGGGGAGGYLTASGFSATAQSYAITVGAGGAISTNGASSVFSSITSSGGGAGGAGSANGIAGASGGGCGNSNTNNLQGGAASPSGQGNRGGNQAGGAAATGGGGAGAQGGDSTTGSDNVGTNGGNGLSSSINGTSTTRAGGGGGWGRTTRGSGGSGGGGQGSETVSFTGATAGAVNTGSGGGAGAAGGSGIVIIRYAI